MGKESKLASRLVQFAFVVVLLGAWYIGTTYGKISPILLPNPVKVWDELLDVLWTLEFVGDLRVTLTELVIAFAISSTTGVLGPRRSSPVAAPACSSA